MPTILTYGVNCYFKTRRARERTWTWVSAVFKVPFFVVFSTPAANVLMSSSLDERAAQGYAVNQKEIDS